MAGFSGTESLAGAGYGASDGASYGPWGALIGGAAGAIIGGLTGQPQPEYDPQTTQLASMSAYQFNQAYQMENPAIQYLTNYAESPETVTNARSNAISQVGTQFNNAQTYQQSLMQQLGITPNAAQSANMGLQTQLAKGAAQAGAANAAAQQTYGLQQQVLGS